METFAIPLIFGLAVVPPTKPLSVTIPVIDHDWLIAAISERSSLPLTVRSSVGVLMSPTEPFNATLVPYSPLSDTSSVNVSLFVSKLKANGFDPVKG